MATVTPIEPTFTAQAPSTQAPSTQAPSQIVAAAIESLTVQADALRAMSGRIGPAFEAAVGIILACKGRLIVSGLGKSGAVGRKMAATFASTGTPSFFIHPTEAMHGDLGMIRPEDVVLLISNSGQTEEVLKMLPPLAHFGNVVIAMAGVADSMLARSAQAVLDVSVERESCPLNLAPTTSTIATMAMGDALAVALMTIRGFKPQDFARFHPGGSLGRKLLTRVSDAMHRTLPVVAPGTPMQEVAVVMTTHRLGVALVLDNTGLEGILTDGDLRRALINPGFSMTAPVDDYMTRKPMTIAEDAMLIEAEEIMTRTKRRLLVAVAPTGKVTGLLEIFD